MRPRLSSKPIEPPAELDAEQRQIFFEIRDSLPRDWFHTCNAQLLAEYAVAIVDRRCTLKAWNNARKAGDLEVELSIGRDLRDGSRLILALSKAMRLAQLNVKRQTITEHKDVAATRRVWEAA